jgi:hypothetical protein
MLNDLYTFSVPVFLRGHAVLSELLRKGEAHAAGPAPMCEMPPFRGISSATRFRMR